MGLNEIMQMVATYGAFPVLFAITLYLLIKTYKSVQEDKKKNQEEREKDQKKDEEREKRYTDMLTSLLTAATKGFSHTKEEEEDNRRVNNFIEGQLNCLLSEEKANRAYLFAYHNGGHDITGRGFQKMSITNEMVDLNTVPIMRSYQNVPRSMFPTLYKTLVSQDVYFIEDLEEIKESDPMSYQMFLTHGAHSVLIHAIKTMEGAVMGFLVMEYTNSDCEDFEKAKRTLEKKALRISGALINKEE